MAYNEDILIVYGKTHTTAGNMVKSFNYSHPPTKFRMGKQLKTQACFCF